VLDGLEAADAPVELDPDLGVIDGHPQAAASPADLLRPERHSSRQQSPRHDRLGAAHSADQATGNGSKLQTTHTARPVEHRQRNPRQPVRRAVDREQARPLIGAGQHQYQVGRTTCNHRLQVSA